MLGALVSFLIHIACLVIPIVAGVILLDAKKLLAEQQEDLGKEKSDIRNSVAAIDISGLEAELKTELDEVERLKADLKAKTQNVEQTQSKLAAKEAELDSKAKEMESRLADLESLQKDIESRAADVQAREDKLKGLATKQSEWESQLKRIESRDAEEASPAMVSSAAVSDDEAKPTEEVAEEEEEEEDAAAEEAAKNAERLKRKKMYTEELDQIMKTSQEEEMEEEDEFEPEAIDALKQAVSKVAYLKKYYDVMKDEVIYFPNVAKCIINYTLMEEAEKYYFDEEDEFPMEYSIALRTVATNMLGDDDDGDEEYMAALAMDVDLGEPDAEETTDEPDKPAEEAAKDDEEDDAGAAEAAKEAERAKRKKMYEEELDQIIKTSQEEEMEDDDEFEPEAIDALKQAVPKVAYLKKYYDVMKDEVIYFPSVAKCIINYSLMEEAEKYYFDEEDEFPMEYSVALRTVATNMIGDDDDGDEDYMAALAMDVEL